MADRDKNWLDYVLIKNGSRRFVHRILFPDKSPVATDDEDPKNVMTHKMAWGESDGTYYVFPTVMEDPETGELKNYKESAFDEALKRRDFISFDNPDDADWFSKHYKSYWDSIGYNPRVDK